MLDVPLQHRPPFLGGVDIAFAKQCPLQITVLNEAEQRVVTGAFEMGVVGGPSWWSYFGLWWGGRVAPR